ncbi:hypothetical protein DQ241_12155 [Blastococcus sp. TF02A-30]|nr:hypothetical protein DQ241_12155 [Blastococcus sp. TF02A-30]
MVTPAPLPAPFRAATRRSRLVADGSGLHWTSARGRTRSWPHGPDGPATARVLSGGRARAAGLASGPLLVVGDAAERPLLVVPVVQWSARPPAAGTGDPLRETGLRPLVDALGLTARAAADDAPAGVPVARAVPGWTGWQSAGAVVGTLALALGVGLGIARGESTGWAAVGLLGFVLLLAAGAGPVVTGLVGERRTRGGVVAELRPDGGRRRLLLVRRDTGPELAVREGDGVEGWLPVGVHPAAVAAVRTTPGTVELVDGGGAVLQSLHAVRWLPDESARQELERLCAAAQLPLSAALGGDRVLDLGTDLPPVSSTWPRMLPRTGFLGGLCGAFAAFNGAALLRGAEGAVQQWLAAGYLAVAVVGLLLWLAVRRS